ncbi:MAG TPA: glycosyltransferase family 39 protein, partial [Candidatus Polarisedimenticolia bacterium]
MKRHAILFLVICLGYLCTLNATDFGSIRDGQVMLDMAVNLHQFGDLIVGYTLDQDKGIIPEVGGGGRYGVGYSLVEQIPILFVGPVERIFGEGSSNVLFPMTNMLVIGLTALLVALSLQAMGRPFRTGALAAAAFAFGTFVWPYVSYDFSEPVQGLCVAAAFFFSVRAAKGRPASRLDLAMAATALGFGVMTKPTLLILAPAFALYLWTGLTGPARRRALTFAWFGLTLAAWGLLIAGVNLHRFGSFLEFGYGRESGQFTTPLAAGLYYLLLGPNRGLVPYAPVALMLPWGLWAARRVDRREVILLASLLAALVLVIAKWWGWEG